MSPTTTLISCPRGATRAGRMRWSGCAITTAMAARSPEMSYQSTTEKLNDYRRQIAELRQKMRATQAEIEPEPVKDYAFRGANGATIKLSELFGEKDTLFVVHNMGASCRYCTLWADGFNGVFEHLRSRASFVVASPDAPEKQRLFAQGRGWRFPMISV